MLKSITINGLRGFGKECTINFSLPNKEDEGSGLNIIVGPNNSGKTTITEAIKFYNSKSGEISFSEGKRNAKNSNKVDITYLDEVDEKMEIHTVKNGGSEVNTIGIKENRKKGKWKMKKERFTKASRPFFFARLSQIFFQRCIHRAGAGSKFLKVVLHQIGKADGEEVYAPDAFIGKKGIQEGQILRHVAKTAGGKNRTQGGKQGIRTGFEGGSVVIHSHQITQPACEYQRDHFQGGNAQGRILVVSLDGLAEADGQLLRGIGGNPLRSVGHERIGDSLLHHFIDETASDPVRPD